MKIDELFQGDLVLGVPTVEAQTHRKMPGDADGNNQGDHCA
ncbi:hypothetical protein OHS18_13340 [Amycolatopsis sp. NBC_00355]